MASGATKKAIVYRFDREALTGFLDAGAPLDSQGVQLLSPGGMLQQIPLETVKLIAFVKDWAEPRPWQRPNYAVRPRQQGIWVRLIFRDGESVEATMQNNLQLLDPLALLVVPPEVGAGLQKVLVPKSALSAFEVLGVIGSPLKKTRPAAPVTQLKMFE